MLFKFIFTLQFIVSFLIFLLGLCSAFGVFYGPVHSILPFLLLGIGIDDMFVIVQCWNNLSKDDSKRSLPTRVGIAMRHAGVSITITSITDFAAFAVGASTVNLLFIFFAIAIKNYNLFLLLGPSIFTIVLYLFCRGRTSYVPISSFVFRRMANT